MTILYPTTGYAQLMGSRQDLERFLKRSGGSDPWLDSPAEKAEKQSSTSEAAKLCR
jgi:hypothetical protein